MAAPVPMLLPERPHVRRALLVVLKLAHTLAFVAIAASDLLVLADGVRGRPRARTLAAASIVTVECAVFAANGFVCPATPLSKRLGAPMGSGTDMYVPGWLGRNLSLIAGTIFAAGLLLNALAMGPAQGVPPLRRCRGQRGRCLMERFASMQKAIAEHEAGIRGRVTTRIPHREAFRVPVKWLIAVLAVTVEIGAFLAWQRRPRQAPEVPAAA